jgi:flagellar FliL protein
MSDEQIEETTEKTGGKKKLVMIVVPIVVVIAGAAGFFLRGGDTAEAAVPTTTVPIVEGDVIEVDTMTVNLVGEEGRYARVGFAVVLDSTAESGAVGVKVPLMRDATLTVMTGFDSTELQTAEGMERLRHELSDAIVAFFPDGEVIRAVLTELIVQ